MTVDPVDVRGLLPTRHHFVLEQGRSKHEGLTGPARSGDPSSSVAALVREHIVSGIAPAAGGAGRADRCHATQMTQRGARTRPRS